MACGIGRCPLRRGGRRSADAPRVLSLPSPFINGRVRSAAIEGRARLAEVGVGAMSGEAFEVGKYGGVVRPDEDDEVGAAPMEVVREGASGLTRSRRELSQKMAGSATFRWFGALARGVQGCGAIHSLRGSV